jgi:PTS system ascorbate-specific IIA component
MTTILIVAHAPLASALKSVASHTYPECAGELLALDVARDATPETVAAEARALIAAVGGAPALVFADVFGATPCRGAERLLADPQVRVVTGVNVPMLWRTLCYGTQEPLDTLVERAIGGATKGVVSLSAGPTAEPCPCRSER